MKKTSPAKSLRLVKQTVRVLSEAQLEQAAGAGTSTCLNGSTRAAITCGCGPTQQ